MTTNLLQTEVVENNHNVENFDQYGRCLPLGVKSAVHEKSRRYFSIDQSSIEYQSIYERLNNAFNLASSINLKEFEQRAEMILEELKHDSEVEGILNGVRIPFILPKSQYDDIGFAMQNIYLDALGQSFSEHDFINHYSQNLLGQLKVVEGSRHDKLISEMKNGVVVGYFFPCLLEYSVPAAIERIKSLPDKFLLAGGYDLTAAFIGSPDILLRKDGYPPLLWLAALETSEEQAGLHFEAYGYDLTFNRRVHLGHVAEYWASGLVVLG